MNLSQSVFQQLKDIAQLEDLSDYKSRLSELDLPIQYASSIGQIMLSAEMDNLIFDGKSTKTYDFDEICTQGKDLRCQVGQVLSHLTSKNLPSKIPFTNNVDGTVLIIDKSGLDLTPDANGKIRILSAKCREKIVLDKYGVPKGMPLCNSFFYADEQIPDTNIFGSGFFVDQDKIMTAAHVMEAAEERGISPKDMLFIRKHLVYGEKNAIVVKKNQLFVLAEDVFYNNDRILNGQRGDLAWLYVRPYFEDEDNDHRYIHQFNGVFEEELTVGIPVYGLGHGLGIPMKLSFKGKVDKPNTPKSDTINCDLNILPGSSGSPIFHAETHQLIGIVSGLHQIYAKFVPQNGCANFVIDMSGILSGVVTFVTPLYKSTIH